MWASAAACMRNYLILREKVRAFRADPEVAGGAAPRPGCDELAAAHPGRRARPGATSAAPPPDIEALAARGMAFEHLDQLALEHLYGVR